MSTPPELDPYLPILYEPSRVVEGFVSRPRFGKPTDFHYLFGTDQQRGDYLVGQIFGGALVLAFFVLWSVLLLVFLCIGKERLGFLAGRAFRLPSTHDGGDPQRPRTTQEEAGAAVQTSWKDAGRDQNDLDDEGPYVREEVHPPSCSNRPTRVRTCFIVFGLIFVVFSILFVTEGLANLQTTVKVINTSAGETSAIASEGLDIIRNGFVRSGVIATSVRRELEAELGADAFCPADPSLQGSADGQEVRRRVVDAVDKLNSLGDFLQSSIQRVESALVETKNAADETKARTDPIDLTDWKVLLAVIPYNVVPAVLMAAVLLSMYDVSLPGFICVIDWFLLPLFAIMVILAWVVAGGMIISAGVNGDFCLPGGRLSLGSEGPDTTIRNVFAMLDSNNTELYQVANYFVSQCRSTDPFQFIRDIQPALQENEATLAQLGGLFLNPDAVNDLSIYCNRDFSGLEELVRSMDTLITLLSDSVVRTLALVDCQRIGPLYTNTVYDGMCTYAPSAVAWVFASTLVMGIMGMLMLTFRSSYKRTVYVGPEDDRLEAYSQWSVDDLYVVDNEDEQGVVIQEVEPQSEAVEQYGLNGSSSGSPKTPSAPAGRSWQYDRSLAA